MWLLVRLFVKKFTDQWSIRLVLGVSFFFAIGFTTAFAATTPPLGVAATYAILSSTYTNTSAGTDINGDIGFTTPPAVTPLGLHTNYGSSPPYAAAGSAEGTLASALALQPCTFSFAAGAIDLSLDTTHGAIGVYTPGVYCSVGAMSVGSSLILSGAGTYIFRAVGALNSTAGAIVTLLGASPCDVFWTPTGASTLGANTTFAGNVVDDAGITVGANTVWAGRALSFGGTVTTDTDTMTAPFCPLPSPPPVLHASTIVGTLLGTIISLSEATGTVRGSVSATTTATTSIASGSLSGSIANILSGFVVSSSTVSGILSGSINGGGSVSGTVTTPISSGGGGSFSGGGGESSSSSGGGIIELPSGGGGSVLGTSTENLPSAPDTGAGGNAPENIVLLFVSALSVLFGFRFLFKQPYVRGGK